MSMCMNTGNVCDYNTYVLFHYLQSSLFACLFSLLIWHHERGLGLVMGITDSGAAVFGFW